MVEPQPSKLMVRVRFPSPAQSKGAPVFRGSFCYLVEISCPFSVLVRVHSPPKRTSRGTSPYLIGVQSHMRVAVAFRARARCITQASLHRFQLAARDHAVQRESHTLTVHRKACNPAVFASLSSATRDCLGQRCSTIDHSGQFDYADKRKSGLAKAKLFE